MGAQSSRGGPSWRSWAITLLLAFAVLAVFWFINNYMRVESGNTAQEVAEAVVARYPPAGADLVLIDHGRKHRGRGESFTFFDPENQQLLLVNVEPFLNLGWQYRSYRRVRLPDWLIREEPTAQEIRAISASTG